MKYKSMRQQISIKAPMKYTSIPRLELAAAVLSTKVSGLIKEELGLTNIRVYYWTDSQVIIGKFWSCYFSFHWLSVKLTTRCPYSLHSFMNIPRLIGSVFVIIWEIFHERISSKSLLLLLLVNFVSGFRLELMYQVPSFKYQVKPHSSPWFSAACADVIVHRNHFFVCTNWINLLNLK